MELGLTDSVPLETAAELIFSDQFFNILQEEIAGYTDEIFGRQETYFELLDDPYGFMLGFTSNEGVRVSTFTSFDYRNVKYADKTRWDGGNGIAHEIIFAIDNAFFSLHMLKGKPGWFYVREVQITHQLALTGWPLPVVTDNDIAAVQLLEKLVRIERIKHKERTGLRPSLKDAIWATGCLRIVSANAEYSDSYDVEGSGPLEGFRLVITETSEGGTGGDYITEMSYTSTESMYVISDLPGKSIPRYEGYTPSTMKE